MEPQQRKGKQSANLVYVEGETGVILIPKWGLKILCDAADLPLLLKYKWCINAHKKRKPYAWTSFRAANGTRVWKMLHQILFPNAEEVDHLNHDTMDYRRSNLRPCTPGQNNQNRPLPSRSGYRGVYQKGNRWVAEIKKDRCKMRLGSFSSPEEAARVRDRKTLELFGETQFLNFPEEYQSL